MTQTTQYLPEAVKDLRGLAGNQRLLVRKAIIGARADDEVYDIAAKRVKKSEKKLKTSLTAYF